ncbi:putative metal-binding motif-containing protein [bacterium]|nr:putative metal-binding motif-containing protein [bacterium]
MKYWHLFLVLFVCAFCFVSCGGEESSAPAAGKVCSSNNDCPIGYSCDTQTGNCYQGSSNQSDSGDSGNGGSSDSGSGDNSDSGSGDNSDSGDGGDSGRQDGDEDPITGKCEPGKKQTCGYEGPDGTENVGPCKAAVRTCKEDGTWGKCEDGYEPVTEIGELCGNGIDDDCNGVVDDGTDIDGDGHGACTDCCESASNCNGYDPATIHPGAYEMMGDEIDNNCNGEVDEATSCDGEDSPLVLDDYAGNAVKLAHAMGICGDQLVSAEISLAGPAATEQIADEQCVSIGTGNRGPRQSLPLPYYTSEYQTFAAEPKFGNNVLPKEGSKMAILSTGAWNHPTQNATCAKLDYGDMKTASKIPEDWINMMKDCVVPKSPTCNDNKPIETGLSNQCVGKEIPTVQDPIMLTLKVKAPMNARAFEFNLFFFSAEYPNMVCNDLNYNDFFIALLDSENNEKYPNDEQNPYDKNLAINENGNFVGVDLAPDGLFTVCGTNGSYSSFCKDGTTLLAGTGFDNLPRYNGGGTNWLTTRGNVVPGEIITLRLALWEQGEVNYGSDHSYDSTVLLDGFRWLPNPAKAGTGQQ